ncbi:MAG: glycoside hydrolase family 13 protein, partial [Chloroflexota bacterium]|nr:glycoside hydrolase family 13 protein [Chloroflexota bacterium]
QVFPDRFAASGRVPKPGTMEPWDDAPTEHGFKGGDLLGIAERLPYLADLGVNALYLNPVFASASNHRYHTYDYLQVDPLLGGDAALRELLDAAHARGMRVILDGVFNHTGRGFWAFHHVLENGAASPYRDWFHFDQAALEGRRPFRPYPWPADHEGFPDEPVPGTTDDERGDDSLRRAGYRAWWGLEALPKLNTDNPEVREHILEVAEHWLRFGIDGWRLDVPTEIRDEGFWQEFRRRCRAVNPAAYIVGEIWDECPEWLAGDRFDAVMNYPLAQAILGFVAQGHLDEGVVRAHHEYGRTVHRRDGAAFGAEIERLMALYDPAVTGVQLNLLDSHDTPRFRTMAGRDRAAYHLAVLLQATLPGAPCTYYGNEVGIEGNHDPDCRRAFPWDGTRWDRDALAWTAAAYRARHALPALRRGELRIVGAAGDAMAFVREAASGGQAVLVAVNAGETAVAIPVTMPGLAGATLADVPLPATQTPVRNDRVVVGAGGETAVMVPPRTGRILVQATAGS